MIRRRVTASLPAILLWAHSAQAQMPPGAPVPPVPEPRPEEPAGTRLATARRALSAGKLDEAHAHGLAALAFAPHSPGVLRLLLQTSKDDADARWLWSARLLLAVLDERGKPRIDDAMRPLLPAAPQWKRLDALVAAHVAAVEELAAVLKALRPTGPRTLGNSVVARHLVDQLLELTAEAPALRRKHATLLTNALQHFEPDCRLVLDALRKLAASDHAQATAARRVLAGLLAQSRYPDLQGPKPPDLSDEELPAGGAAPEDEALTCEQLAAMTAAEQREFTTRHGSWDRPGTALSANGHYRIQTTCGYETLLGAARGIERVHAALAAWAGKDPFGERPGLVRIVPGHDDLEEQGAPFWWAGGFQSGDQTVVRLAWGSVEDLSRTLLHELTHRFDGVLHAFQPAWANEGRAVWTSKAWRAGETGFLANHLDPWQVVKADTKGYGRPGRLTALLQGTIADYRDNYTAGYALWVYLSTWEADGVPLFTEPLTRFLRNARAAGDDPLGYFVAHFADGQAGRPQGIERFARGFDQFLQGCSSYSQARPVDWLSRYALAAPEQPSRDQVGDERTFSWVHTRAEPWFGEGHARRAGEVLARAGQVEPAAAALLWSLRTDGFSPDSAGLLAERLTTAGRADAAWVVRHWLARCAERTEASSGPMPLLATLPRTSALLLARAEGSKELAAAEVKLAARTLAAEQARLAGAFGATTVPLPELPATLVTRFPRTAPAVALSGQGLVEDGLTDFEDQRAAGHWYEDGEGSLHVGRPKPRDQTGALDRSAGRKHSFVRSAVWQPPGAYVLRARIHPTTSYVSGAVVIGMERRDHNVRLRFRAGDSFFASGRSEVARMDKVELALTGTFEREGQLPGSAATHLLRLPAATPHLEFELRIRGATVEVFVEDERVLAWTSPDHAPIQGFIGFAMDAGAVRVQEPTVTRLDRGPGFVDPPPAAGLDLTRQGEADPHDLLRLPTLGVPGSPNGTLVLYIPPWSSPEQQGRVLERVAATLAALRADLARADEQPQPWLLAVPAAMTAPDRERLLEQFRAAAGPRAAERVQLMEHGWSSQPLRPDPTALFVDGHGVLRAEGGIKDSGLTDWVRRWMRCYRAQ
jgi:hypothetical protein